MQGLPEGCRQGEDGETGRKPGDSKTGPKRCPRCKQTKDSSEFRVSRFTCDGLEFLNCLPCSRIVRRSANLQKKSGMDMEEFITMLAAQGNLCAICGIHLETFLNAGRGRTSFVDHSHSTGRFAAFSVCGELCVASVRRAAASRAFK